MRPDVLPATGVDLLDRHQRRREMAIPTVTVMAGPVTLGIRRWRAWSLASQRAFVCSSELDINTVISAWILGLTQDRDLVADACHWLAATLGYGAEEMQLRLTSLTRYDFEVFWSGLAFEPVSQRTARVCEGILLRRVQGLSPAEGLDTPQSETNSRRVISSGAELLHGLIGLVPQGHLPTLLLAPVDLEGPLAATRMPMAAKTVCVLAETAPQIPVAFVTPHDPMVAFLRAETDSRTGAMLREGLVIVERGNEAYLRTRLQDAGLTAPPATLQYLVCQGVDSGTADAFVEALRHPIPPHSPEQEDEARSGAERFLYEVLESLPQTAGHFALNRPLEFRHGQAPAEADLVAPHFRLAIELDGGYYHLADRETYRRDRRKDWNYQRHGYLVLRFLSEDVVARLEEILDTILAAVAHQRQVTLRLPNDCHDDLVAPH